MNNWALSPSCSNTRQRSERTDQPAKMDSSNAAKTGKRTKTTTVDTEDFTSRSHKDVRSGKKRFSDGPATVDEVLAWLLEQLALQGAVGLSTNWRPGHFSSMFSVSANDLDTFSEFPNNGADLTTGLGGAIRDHSRESWLGEVTTQHRALFPKVVTLVESKLLAHGIAREKFRKLNPRDKLIMLAEANLPKAPNLPTITLYLVVSKDVEGDANESKPLAFPRDVTFVHFQAVLRDLTDDSAIRAGRTSGYTLLDGPWRYQLLGRDKDIVPGLPKFEIADEADFRQMIRQLSDKDTPSACIYHVGKPS